MDSADFLDDAALVTGCRAGDPAAWQAVVKRYQRLVFAVVRSAGLDDQTAADVFQTVFLRLMNHLHRIDEPSRLQAWIVTTAKREAWLQRRQAKRVVNLAVAEDGSPGLEIDQIADDADTPEQALEHWQQVTRVERALQRLDVRCRRLLQALFDDGGDYGAIARQFEIPVGSIGPTRARCLAKLRRLID